MSATVRFNIGLAAGEKTARFGWLLDPERERQAANHVAGRLRIKAASADQQVMYLSGGNQQKVVLARWLLAGANVFLLDEPTRGIDVGAKKEMYDLIRALAEEGAAILFASSELEEILSLADRVLVLHRGRITGELSREEANEERIMQLATGGSAL